MIRPDSAQAMGEDLLYDVSENREVVAFFDEFRGIEVQMDLAELNQPTGTATGAEVQAEVDRMEETVRETIGWNMDTQLEAMQAEATRFGELMATADFNRTGSVPEADRRLQELTASFYEDTPGVDQEACRERCLATPGAANRINRIVVLGSVASLVGLTLTAAGVPAIVVAAAGAAILFGANVALLAYQLNEDRAARRDARIGAEVRQQANHALLRMAVLGRTTLQAVFNAAGDGGRGAVQTFAQNVATGVAARQDGDGTADVDQAFIEQMDMILDRV